MYRICRFIKNPNVFMYSSICYINSILEDTGTYQTAVKIADPAFFILFKVALQQLHPKVCYF